MDIFTPIDLSEEVKSQIEASKIASFNKEILDNMIVNYETAFNMFWNNPNASPQSICDRFGASAYKLFAASDMTRSFIVNFRPDYVSPVPPYQFTINQNGTITIGDPIQQPQ